MEETHEAPHVDFSLQLGFAKNDERVEARLFNVLKDIATDITGGIKAHMGALVVLGDFSQHSGKVHGLVQMKPKQNPVDDLITVDDESIVQVICQFSEAPMDGAIVVDKTGQVIGAGVYLVVENPTLDTPEDCGTRHKAAASFSLREDVISVLTLSEETNTVRIWRDGKPAEVYKAKPTIKETSDE